MTAAAPSLVSDRFLRRSDAGFEGVTLAVDNIHCAGCMRKIESNLNALPGVIGARVNLSTRRLTVDWEQGRQSPDVIITRLEQLGYPAAPVDPRLLASKEAAEEKRLLTAIGVAGFAAANVMLLSVAVWSGLASGMGEATRVLMYWVSGLIALPAVAWAGQPFFQSAWRALRNRSVNMDVPISLAIILSALMSIVATLHHDEHAYFDASVTLLFFLLIGRYLDHRAKSSARSVAQNLLALRATAATVIDDDGQSRRLPIDLLRPGMTVMVAAGERIPADGRVIDGRSDIDMSLVTGESLPRPAGPDSALFAGTLNLSAALRLRVTAADEDSLLSDIVRLMENAEQGRARYVRLADRAAALYVPLVHTLAALTFLGWLFVVGVSWDKALMHAIAVLIITCPCALGLAVPAVQVVAAGNLLRHGVLMKSGDALERLAVVDHIVFDKTGTLTLGTPTLVNRDTIPDDLLRDAAALAATSRHPLSQALVRAAGGATPLPGVVEIPGQGLETDGRRLGSRDFAGLAEATAENASELWYRDAQGRKTRFLFADRLRPDAAAVIAALKARGIGLTLLSGDRPQVVSAVAADLGITDWTAEMTPQQKIAHIEDLKARGRRVAMVGDGLNDAPALAAAFVSLSPASAADISQTAADFVFQGSSLAPLIQTVDVARASRRRVIENFSFAAIYNLCAIPVAVMGLVTPLIAAIAMSGSSLVVILNALRLRGHGQRPAEKPQAVAPADADDQRAAA